MNDQLAHLRACHDTLGGNMLQIVREDHPAWKARAPRARPGETAYFDEKFKPAFDAFRAQRAELLTVLEPLPAEAWARTATVTATAPPATRCTSTASSTTATGWRATSAATSGASRRILKELAG